MVRVLPTRVLVAVAVLSLVACSDGSDEATTSATVGTAAPSTTAGDPYAVPAVIDENYVNRVLAGLDAAVGEVVRLVVSTKSIPPEAIDRLKAIYANNQLVQLRIDQLQDDLRRQLQNYRNPPGDIETRAVELITAEPSCMYAKVTRDFSDVAISPSAQLSSQWVALKPSGPPAASQTFNPTGWALIYDGFEQDLSAPKTNPCFA